MNPAFVPLLLVSFVFGVVVPVHAAEDLRVQTRSRILADGATNQWSVQERERLLDPGSTAVVVCDMWDKHWCPSATARVSEMAPRMNQVLQAARGMGMFIIHCPSDTLEFYKDHPARARAQKATKVEPRVPLSGWCSLDPKREAPLPIDDSNGGCQDCIDCRQHRAWSRQIDLLQIQPQDAITDSAEAYYLMRERGITNVIIMGVHVNMCVLGRPFAIRQLRNQGLNVLLMRDLTDAMYESSSPPYVNHFRGTELVVEHIEKYWCPTITSAAFLGGEPFRFKADHPAKVVFLIGEDEYKTWLTLPEFAEAVVSWRGFKTAIVHQSPENKHSFPSLVAELKDADLLVISVRRRIPPKEQLSAIAGYLDQGKPLVGIRTASHAFAPSAQDASAGAGWVGFDAAILGGNYQGHHGNVRTQISAVDDAASHPILAGVDLSAIAGNGSLYVNNPLRPGTYPLLLGKIPGKPAEPVAWTYEAGQAKSRIFYTSLGHPDDFKNPQFRRLLLNGILWTMKLPVPPDNRLQNFAAP